MTGPQPSVGLLWVGRAPPPVWPLGQVCRLPGMRCADLADAVRRALSDDSAHTFWLLWDSALNAPDPECVRDFSAQPGDVWHAGLRHGTAGLPGIIDFIQPTWMHNRDPDPAIEATSWRLSLRACLIRTEVLRQLGGPLAEFQSPDAAGLELGHRYLRRGAVVRHVPQLLPAGATSPKPELPLDDELRFAHYRFGEKWARWALGRALLSRYRPRRELLGAWRRVRAEPSPPNPEPFHRPTVSTTAHRARVTVLIPTLQRYPYLHTVLDQLRTQTVPPHEIIVVDQTPHEERDLSYREAFADLSLVVIERDEAGQCSARNAGLVASSGDHVLFIDDDDEVEPDLIERHLLNLSRFGGEVSSGVAEETGAGPLPPDFKILRMADVFPTNNTLIRKSVLYRSGLFDLAFNRGQRADADLGMRVYLGGALMVLNPEISVFHHHAPRGGLRTHGARVITYASSRQRFLHRHLPSVSEIYLDKRYFSRRQVREALWQRAMGTLGAHGPRRKKLAKAILGLMQLPDTVRQIRLRCRQADEMLREFPRIPSLAPTQD